MYNLEQIKQTIIANGSITSSDIPDLRKIVYKDGRVSREEADFLFDLRKEILNFGNLKEWDIFFIQAICDHLLEESHDTITDDDVSWLIDKIGADKYIDHIEQELLCKLSSKVKYFPSYDLGCKILSLLCRNSKTGRSLQFGINKVGCRKNKIVV